jgi:hypothetical protein
MAQSSDAVPEFAAKWIASVLRPGLDNAQLAERLQSHGGLRFLLGMYLISYYCVWRLYPFSSFLFPFSSSFFLFLAHDFNSSFHHSFHHSSFIVH